jgi:O-antigen/teichoic acid export membrane protein
VLNVAAEGAVITAPGAAAPQIQAAGVERSYIRGSGLLLVGRIVAIGLNFAAQVLTVRYLTKADYGAFAYALAAVSLGSTIVHVGLEKAVPRLIPMYYERGDHARMFGSIALATGTVWGLGLSLVLLLFGFRGVIGGAIVTNPLSLSLLLVLIVLSPVGAFTTLLEHLVAVFSGPRAIFLRRHVLGPGLKLAAVLVVIASTGDVHLLAYGYVIGGLIGVWVYAGILLREWRRKGLLQHLRPKRLNWNARELFGFGLPLLVTDLAMIIRASLVVIMLAGFHSTTAVAEYNAVVPVARLNMLVYEAFGLLFVPLAARMFERNETEGISELYWKTSIWIAVLTFPVFAVTCALAEPVTVLLFGSRYSGTGPVLAVLALGWYLHAALGFNAATLRVHGKLRIIVATDILAALTAVVLSLLLIPRYGALGAAVSTTATLILYNLFTHLGLWLGHTGVRLVEGRFVRVSVIALLLIGALLLSDRLIDPPFYVSFATAVAVSLLLIRSARQVIRPEATFPELLRIPLVRHLLS